MAHGVERPNLSVKLERLKIGLKSDTIGMPHKEPKFTTRSGLYDPLCQRSKRFRKAITTYAPPYYFWHKDYMNTIKLKPIIKADQPAEEMDTNQNEDELACVWCERSVAKSEYEFHLLKKCKKRHEFSGNGYYQCASCKESFLDEMVARRHVSKHFPNQKFVDANGQLIQDQNTAPKSFDIICRDQAKRKKWL